MTDERLNDILAARRTLVDTVYGSDPQSGEGIIVAGEEIEAMARELWAMRERNRRMALAIVNGDSKAILREYAKAWK